MGVTITDVLSGLVLIVVILFFFNAIFNQEAYDFCKDNGYNFQGKVFQVHQCWKLNEQNEVVIRQIVFYGGDYHFVVDEPSGHSDNGDENK